MAGEFGSGPTKPKVPFGHVDVVQPFETPSEYSKTQRRRAESAVEDLALDMGLRCALTEDLEKRPGSYLIHVIGKKSLVDEFRFKLAELDV